MSLDDFIGYIVSEKYALLLAMLIGLICPFIVDFIKRVGKHSDSKDLTIANALWESEIYEGENIIKRDEIRVIRDKKPGAIYGFVNRISPTYLRTRRWHMRGICKDDKVVCINWSDQFSEHILCASFVKIDDDNMAGTYYRYDPILHRDAAFKIELHRIRKLTIFERVKLTFMRGV